MTERDSKAFTNYVKKASDPIAATCFFVRNYSGLNVRKSMNRRACTKETLIFGHLNPNRAPPSTYEHF